MLLLTVALMLAATGPALAQTAEEAPSPGDATSSSAIAVPAGEPAPPLPPDYELQEDGSVVVQGDVVFPSCRQFALYLGNDSVTPPGDMGQAQSVLEQCEEEQDLPPEMATLPDTSGVPLLPLAGGITLLALGGLLLRRRLT